MGYLAACVITVGSWLAVPGGSWEPTHHEVAEARSQLESYVSRQASLAKERLPDWSSYTFQYQGQALRGKRLIVVNAFCSAPPANAATDLVRVFDGGACYFTAHWDPDQKIFMDVAFNGHA